MKTICPHCKQEFPDTPDEYLGTAVECSACHRNFVAKKAKFCSECGAINPGQALTCAQCGKPFPAMQQLRPASAPVQNYEQEDIGEFSWYDDDDCFVEEVDLLTPWRKWWSVGYRGRSCRKEYLLYVLGAMIVGAIAVPLSFLGAVVYFIFSLVEFLVGVSVMLRRMHDIGISACWLLPMLIPGLAVIPFGFGNYHGERIYHIVTILSALSAASLVLLGLFWLFLAIWPSQPGANQYGPNPVGEPGGQPYCKFNPYSILIVAGIVYIALLLAMYGGYVRW